MTTFKSMRVYTRQATSAFKKLVRKKRIAAKLRPVNCVVAYNKAEVADARPGERLTQLHPTKGFRNTRAA